MIRVKLLNWYRRSFDDKLVVVALQSLAPITFVSHLDEAELIVCSYHGLKKEVPRYGLQRMPVLGRLFSNTGLVPHSLRPDQTSLYVSAECPVWSRFLQSGCDYGISHEFLPSVEEHLRLPYWFYSIDWTEYGIDHASDVRSGVKIKPQQLLEPRASRSPIVCDHLPMITSHLNGFKAFFYNEIRGLFPIDLAGRGRHEITSKQAFLAEGGYGYCLTPENLIYPGYYTEKVLEAWSCGVLPITCHDELACHDFNPASYINLFSCIPSGIGRALKEVLMDVSAIDARFSAPLLHREPSIKGLIDFLGKVLDTTLNRTRPFV